MPDVGTMAIEYLDYDERAIEEELGARLSIAPQEPEAAIRPPSEFTFSPEDLGIGEEALKLAKRIFKRTSKELHEVLCGSDPENEADRKKLKDALKLGDEALVAAIAAVLAGPLGLGAAVAAAIAALLLKRIFKPAGEEICKYWGENLGEQPAP